MRNDEFMLEVEAAYNRSKRVLLRKADEYTSPEDRLENFKRAAKAQGISTTQALMGMVTKHYISIAEMSKDPEAYSIKLWREKVSDLRNYTFFLDAILTEEGIELE